MAGVDVQDLVITGDGSTYGTASGISLFTDLPGAGKLDHVRIARVEVSGFRQGVEIGAWGGPGGYRDVRVTDAQLHDNRDAGLLTYGPLFDAGSPAYAHENVRISRVFAYHNLGDPQNRTRNTGSGIVLGSVRGRVVEQSTAYGNGAACAAPEGPVGIWTYDATSVVLQRNTSYSNRTGGRADGGGFDLDQNVSGSTAQYNSSWDNDGPGYLVYTGQLNDAQSGNVVRFNLSRDDVRAVPAYGAVTVRGRIRGADIMHNTVSVSSTATAPRSALQLEGPLSGVTIRNNIFAVQGQSPVVLAPALGTSAVRLQGNDHRTAGAAVVRWGGTSYGSLAAWRSATGQELLDGRTTGTGDDPMFTDGSGAAGLRLTAGSPLRTSGLDVRSLFGTSPGPRDFYGTALAATRTTFAVGAYQPAG